MLTKLPHSKFKNKTKTKIAVFTSLDYWLNNDFKHPRSWWYRQIGVPKMLGPILLILDDELSDDQRKKGITILKRGKIGLTGQNLVWLAGITLNRGLLERAPSTVKRAFDKIAREIKTSSGEGIQFDFSFHQHGPCLYNHGYGKGFAQDCSRIAALATNTSFVFPPDKITLLTKYILDGSQWMTYRSIIDYGAAGREITRPNLSANYLIEPTKHLLKLKIGREKE